MFSTAQKLSLLLLVALLPLGCRTKVESRNRFEENSFPNRVLWVWERPEDLEFLDPQQFAVAFLAQTLTLKNDDVVFSPRRQPLKVSPEVKLIAVTRIESQKTTGTPTALSAVQRKKLVDLVLQTLDLKNVSAVQIDFDAVVSEREFYRSLLTDLRQKLPNNIPLSMTALASFCVGDRWLDDLPVDEDTVEIFNRHFPLQLLVKAARDPDLPDYLQGRLVLAIWTRAILLNNDEVATKVAPQVVKVAPKIEPVFREYLEARTPKARHEAALYVLLKFPDMSPYLASIIPTFSTSEDLEYFFDTSWWCAPSETEYNDQGVEVPKVIPKPSFLTAAQLETARREYRALIDVGDGKSYLGQQVIAWAKASPANPKIPEALFIAAMANEAYKNGCDSWEHDEASQRKVKNS